MAYRNSLTDEQWEKACLRLSYLLLAQSARAEFKEARKWYIRYADALSGAIVVLSIVAGEEDAGVSKESLPDDE